MTKGSAWKIGKGCFGGSVPGKRKYINSRQFNKPLIASIFNKGTVGSKLLKRIS